MAAMATGVRRETTSQRKSVKSDSGEKLSDHKCSCACGDSSDYNHDYYLKLQDLDILLDHSDLLYKDKRSMNKQKVSFE